MLTSYVTDAQLLERFPTGDLEELQRHAQKAAGLARRATRGAVYRSYSDGEPHYTATLEAFQQSVLAQVAFWQDNDIDAAGPVVTPEPAVVSRSLDNRSVTYDNTAGARAQNTREGSLLGLVADALIPLQDAGLVTASVRLV